MGTNCLNTLLLENVGSALLKVGFHGSLVTDGLSQDFASCSTETGQIKVQK